MSTAFIDGLKTVVIVDKVPSFLIMLYYLIVSILFHQRFIQASSVPSPPSNSTNELGLKFMHEVDRRENLVRIYFDIFSSTLDTYRYYYFDLRSFGHPISQSDFLPRQRLTEIRNSLLVVGLHEDDYVVCLTFIDAYENIFRPRYSCYEFTFGEKTIGTHHANQSGYLVPLLVAVAFILHFIIAVVHHLKEKNYAQKLLHRFIDVRPRANRRKYIIENSLKQLDHPHLSASVQRRLSRVSIEGNSDNISHHSETLNVNESTDELPLYTLPHHSRRVSLTAAMDTIHEHGQTGTLESISSTRNLIEVTPTLKRSHRPRSNGGSQLHF